jgi:acetolactate synthase I/II/III large subunit
MKVYEALARAFAAEGVTDVFGMMGDANMYWMYSLQGLGVRLYECRHEGAALGIADGMARITGQPGVVTTTCGPGTAQIATTALVAARARTPLVAFCGEAPLSDPEYVQHLDQARFAAACELGYFQVSTANGALEATQRAFYQARAESRPVMLSVPMDIQQMTIDDDDYDYKPSFDLLTQELVYPNPLAVSAAADAIASSERPVIVVGRGAMASGAGEAVLALAENIGAIIATTLLATTWLGQDDYHVGVSGLYSTRTAMELFGESDCVIAVGAGMNNYTTEHGYLYPAATFVQIDTKPSIVMGDGRAPDHFIHGDARLAVEQLNATLVERGVHSSGFRTPEVKDRLVTALDDVQQYDLEPGTVDPRDVCRFLDEAVPADVGLILGGGASSGFSTMLMTRQRRVMLANHHFGCIGMGLLTALGVVTATENQPAMLLDGDAGFMMHLAEFETAVRYKMPLMVVVLNDQRLGSEYHKAKTQGIDTEYTMIPTPDLGAVGRSLGGRGALVTQLDDLRSVVAEFVANPAPTLVDVRFSGNVVTIPYRRVHYGQDA